MKRKWITRGTVVRETLREAVYDSLIGISRADAIRFVDQVLDEITKALVNDEEVKLHGFGIFKVRHKRQRIARNMRTGGKAIVSSRRVVTFKPSITILNILARSDLDRADFTPTSLARHGNKITDCASEDRNQENYIDEGISPH